MLRTGFRYGIPWRSGTVVILLAIAAALAIESCGKSHQQAGMAQKTFASPEQAGIAVFAAAQSGNRNRMLAIFGPNSRAILFTGDPATDTSRLNNFVVAYNQMHRWGEIKAGGQVLIVGAENVIFPIPLAKNSSGQWYFDTAAGADEILARRIGKGELTAMDATAALAAAEEEYHRQTHDGEYAQKFVSDPGKHNGLYWPVGDGHTASPLGQFGDFVAAQNSVSGGREADFNGYHYRILSKGQTSAGMKDYLLDGKMTGGFAILASPVEYRSSGILSFLIGPSGTLYEKDLGKNTLDIAAGVSEYNPADGWILASQPFTHASRMQQ